MGQKQCNVSSMLLDNSFLRCISCRLHVNRQHEIVINLVKDIMLFEGANSQKSFPTAIPAKGGGC